MNKKKIRIVIISILVFVIITCIALTLYNKNILNFKRSNLSEYETIQNEVVENTADTDMSKSQEETNTQNESQLVVENPTIQKENEAKTLTTETNSKTTSEKKDTKHVETKSKTTQKENTKTETPKTVESKTTTVTTEIPKKEEIKEDPKPTQSTTDTNTEKYVKNDAMISKIKSIIQNNESDFMKQYGYNIVVDSSIKEQTNQFTYTESRVINYLKYKFGTIRIYAEDYYKNGNLIMTMCYIL